MQSILLILSIFFLNNPQNSIAYTELNDWVKIGEASYVKADFHNAVLYFSKAIEANNKDPEAYLMRAKAFIMLNKYQLAMDDYQLAMKIDPDFVKAYLRLQKGVESGINTIRNIENLN